MDQQIKYTSCSRCGIVIKKDDPLVKYWSVEANIAICYDCQWSSDIPVTPGIYWFYGWLYKQNKDKTPPRFTVVEAWGTHNSVRLIAEGQFLRSADMLGYFKHLYLPLPPSLKGILNE